MTITCHRVLVTAVWWEEGCLPLQGPGAQPLPPLFFGPSWRLWWNQGQSTPGLRRRDEIALATSARHREGTRVKLISKAPCSPWHPKLGLP